MLRNILSVIAGFAVWTVLWLGSNSVISLGWPAFFKEDGSTESTGILLLLFVLSVVFSVVAGYLTVMVARARDLRSVSVLGILLLVVGLFVQIQIWDMMPLWYHLLFLLFLFPAPVAGGALRMKQDR